MQAPWTYTRHLPVFNPCRELPSSDHKERRQELRCVKKVFNRCRELPSSDRRLPKPPSAPPFTSSNAVANCPPLIGYSHSARLQVATESSTAVANCPPLIIQALQTFG